MSFLLRTWLLVLAAPSMAVAGDYDFLGEPYQFLAARSELPTTAIAAVDERPVITVYSFPGCRPCQQLERDSQRLPGYRWVFAGPGPGFDLYPRLSWVSPRTGTRVYMAGQWNGPDWWHRAYMEPPSK